MKLNKAFSADIKVEDGKREVSAVITTSVVDRDREVVVAQGVNAKQYMTNPVVLYNHTYGQFDRSSTAEKLPVGKCVALKRTDAGLEFKMQFAERPATHPEAEAWLPDTLLSLYQQGVMRAFSIGFDPTESRPPTAKDVENYGGECRRVISKSVLYEVSCVALPANQDAVATAVSKGLLTAEQATEMFGDGHSPDAPPDAPGTENQQKTRKIVRTVDAPSDVGRTHDVVRAVMKCVEVPEPPAPLPGVKCVHRVIRSPAVDPDAKVRRLVLAAVAKQCGRLYED